MRRPDVIVTDLDRTFTDARLRMVPAAVAALQAARRSGIKTVLATGRTLPELQRKTGLLGLFDALIAEGGGLLGTPARVRPARDDLAPLDRLTDWARNQGVFHARGVCSLSLSRADLPRVRRAQDLRPFTVLSNRNRTDITLKGVDKGSALRLLRRDHPLPGRILAFGDAENDVQLLRAAHWRVAVRNAVPALKRIAHDQTRYPGGRGVADFLRRHVLLAGRDSR